MMMQHFLRPRARFATGCLRRLAAAGHPGSPTVAAKAPNRRGRAAVRGLHCHVLAVNPDETQFANTDDQPAPPRASEPARAAEHVSAPRRERGGGGAGLLASHPWLTLVAAAAIGGLVDRIRRR
jgi:hypothetical protein